MSSKSKKFDKGFEFGFITKLEFDGLPERRTIKSVMLQSELHGTPETIKAHLTAFGGDALTPAIVPISNSSSSILLSELSKTSYAQRWCRVDGEQRQKKRIAFDNEQAKFLAYHRSFILKH